ncbi:MAG: class I SAM-dependent methyltransferase [Planctomycetota bacterium]|jgi:predicted nicotinamide N-methyase
MTVPEAMRDQNLRRFPLRRHVIHGAGGALSIVAPSSSEDLLREGDLAERCERRDRPPYWADIWPASVGLARFILRGPSLEGQKAVDLGCGIGVAGAAAARRGAEVIFADREADALHFAAFNAAKNGAQEHAELRFDWDREYLPAGIDLLLLADVAYHPPSHHGLLRQVEAVIGSGGRAFSADPFRSSTNDFIKELERKYAVEHIDGSVHFEAKRWPLRLVSVSARDA